MLDLFDRCLCRQSHLFKRSVLLIKAWCSHESRTLGSRNGLMATYALEILVMCLLVTNGRQSRSVHGSSFSPQTKQWHPIEELCPPLKTPLEVLRRFLHYYATFEWDKYAITVR